MSKVYRIIWNVTSQSRTGMTEFTISQKQEILHLNKKPVYSFIPFFAKLFEMPEYMTHYTSKVTHGLTTLRRVAIIAMVPL
jgi:hypothetical protein